MSASARARELVEIAARAANEKFGSELIALDVSEHLPLSDVFLVCSGRNERMVVSIADEVDRQLSAQGAPAIRQEGRRDGRWVLLDCGEIIVHIFHEEERLFYQLERLWRDSPVVELPVFDSPGPDPDA
jgi:ribosome-associated protein